MKPLKFSLYFITIIVICTLSTIYLPETFNKPSYYSLHFTLIGVYTAICLGVYIVANLIANGKNTKYFTQLIMLNVMVKMFVTAILMLVFVQNTENIDMFIVVPFGIIYLLFTVFESWFLILINPKT